MRGLLRAHKIPMEAHGGASVTRMLLIFATLLALWLAMSGIYDSGLILGLGVVSCFLCVWIIHRLGLVFPERTFGALRPLAAVRYIFWLIVEIGKADWAVAKVILSTDLPKRQRLIKVVCQQSTDLGRALFANSITITPGTITVETEDDCFIVHALTDEAADMEALDSMGARVAALEVRA